ncbi:hypothetical protein HOLleu_17345 [Holothuria leucospilota]|uniref:Uncharacterized protein n=1 Tax=Holothuria leucospilota TaxID=206669 RepID=A0A9Q1H8E9_HOLLE|nr:hypothetical protein HOLleu_17345 [Holothuria leucospilota]
MDPIPNWLLKKCIKELAPIITKIINGSRLSGIFPESLKVVHITPLIKNPSSGSYQNKDYQWFTSVWYISRVAKSCAHYSTY